MKWLQGLLGEPVETEPSGERAVEAGTTLSVEQTSSDAAVAMSPTAEINAPESAVAPTPVAAPAVVDLGLVLGRLDELAARQDRLQQLFETRLRSDEVQGKMLERLHDELQQYKTNFVRQSFMPLLKETIFCHDFVAQQADKLIRAGIDGEATAARQSLDATRQMLIDLLFKFDVEPYRQEEPGNMFDPRTQQCVQMVPTDQPDLDRRVAVLGACGFRSGDTILRREHVSVYKYAGEAQRPADPRSQSTAD